jgi:AraC-like DNA-binding protein
MRRGVHAHHARGQVALAEAGLALLYRGDEPYRLSHPHDRDLPDRSTCVEFGPAVLEEAFGRERLARDLGAPLSPRTQLLNFAVMSALRPGAGDRLASEEMSLGLVRAIAGDFGLARDDPRVPVTARRRVERARAFIAAEPEADHKLEEVAAAAACSPFHLARLFKRLTGMTIRGYRLRLRLATALQDLADGSTDLTGSALRAGFSDHSHMTASFRKTFGRTPSSLRDELGTGGLRKQSKLLQAAAAPRA